jgi:hypothetical protein
MRMTTSQNLAPVFGRDRDEVRGTRGEPVEQGVER